jgi:hypothetical protein
LKVETDGNLHHMASGGQLGGLDRGSTLEIHRLDSEVLEGRISTKAPVTFDEKTYSFDVTFSVALTPKELPKVSVSGSSSPAANLALLPNLPCQSEPNRSCYPARGRFARADKGRWRK